MINVVMLVRKRMTLTVQALTSLKDHTSGPFNLTVVEDGSDSHMEPHVGSIIGSDHYTLLKVFNSKGITGMARNLGIYFAEKYWGRGDWLYLSDNDVYFTEGWDVKLTDLFDMFLKLKLLGGSTHPFHGVNQEHPTRLGSLHTHDAVSGYSQLMRWETWDKHGPLDAHAPGIRQSEDWAFCQKIIKDGGLVGSIDPPVVYDCGLTDTFGNPAIGVDQIPRYEGIIQE